LTKVLRVDDEFHRQLEQASQTLGSVFNRNVDMREITAKIPLEIKIVRRFKTLDTFMVDWTIDPLIVFVKTTRSLNGTKKTGLELLDIIKSYPRFRCQCETCYKNFSLTGAND